MWDSSGSELSLSKSWISEEIGRVSRQTSVYFKLSLQWILSSSSGLTILRWCTDYADRPCSKKHDTVLLKNRTVKWLNFFVNCKQSTSILKRLKVEFKHAHIDQSWITFWHCLWSIYMLSGHSLRQGMGRMWWKDGIEKARHASSAAKQAIGQKTVLVLCNPRTM